MRLPRLTPHPLYALWFALGVLGASLLASPAYGQRGATLSGTVTNAAASQPIGEAAITLFPAGSHYALTGTASGSAGRYRLAGIAPGPYRVTVQAPGYQATQRRIRLDGGQSETLDIALQSATSGAEAIVTTPALRAESVRRASAPVSVVDEAALHRSAALSPLDGLRAVPGVHLVRTGLGQRRLSLPDAGAVSLRGPLVLVDGRRAGLPGAGASVTSLLPAPAIDLKRVEVVQGGAAVVHGPAARSGVIHAITKNPFDDPGTAIAVAGGAPVFTQGQFRHAAVIGSTFGYEIVTYGAQGASWPFTRRAAQGLPPAVLDPSDPVLPNQRVDPTTGQLRRDDGYWTAGIHGEAAYRVGAQTTVTARGGYTALTGPLYTTWGPLQADPLGYAFAQLRLEAGAMEAQVGLNNTQTGTSYWYGTGQTITNRDVAYDAQLHYRIDKPYWMTTFTVGADGHWVRPRTGRSLMGRHEERDALDRYGAFGAARTTLSPWLTLSYAARADIDTRSTTLWPAVQVAALADVAANHTVRLQYERSASGPGAHALFLDTDVYRQPLGGAYRLVHRARGGTNGFSFDQYRGSGQATSLIPGEMSFGEPLAPFSIPLGPLYDAALARLPMAWGDLAAQPAPVQQLTSVQRQQFVDALGELADAFNPGDRTAGTLGLPDGQGSFRSVSDPRDVPPVQRPVTQAVSMGYHGVMGNRLEATADAYAGTTKNAIRPQMASPLVFAPQVRADLEPVLASLITQATSDPDDPLGRLINAMGMTPDEAAAFTAQAVEHAYDGVPVGVVTPDQAAEGSSTEQRVLLTYGNVGRVYQAGVRLGARVSLHDKLRVNGAVAVRHLTQWGRSAADGSSLALRGAPPVEAHVGVEWVRGAWTVHAAAHYAAAHSVRVGWYAGTVETAYPVDVGLRFDAGRYIAGVSAQLAVQNVLNQSHRGLVEAPATGRLAWIRLAYAL